MKMIQFVMMGAVVCLLCCSSALGFDSGSTGADGPFNPTTNTVVTLPADGKLNYTTVSIPAGVTVTFQRNAANTPVYILATGNVTIGGTISLNGTSSGNITPGQGGSGGFDGGLGANSQVVAGKGMGPGGGNPGNGGTVSAGGGGGFATAGGNGPGGGSCGYGGTGGGTYGNSNILPLIGGSGGGGGSGSGSGTGGGGGGGGGAILIASSGTITVTGSITANGGNGSAPGGSYAGAGGAGSGGAIKLMANTITGEGTISANGAGGNCNNSIGANGGTGRIRFEANSVTRTANTSPSYTFNNPGPVFLASMPTLTIVSVGGMNAPVSPSGKYGTLDISLPSTTTNPVTVNISATNIPVGTTITVSSIPQIGPPTSSSGTLSGADASSTATSVSMTLSTSYQSIITAQATFTVQTAMFYDGEKIEKVRVASAVGRDSETVYITKSGKEIRAELIAKMIMENKF